MLRKWVAVFIIVLGTGMLAAPVPANGSDSEAQTCAEAVAAGSWSLALERCRQEHEQSPDAAEITRLLARAEFAEGNAGASVELWEQLLEQEGWSEELAHELAMALWRSGAIDEAESRLRDTLERSPNSQAYEDMISFLSAFNRWQDAIEMARTAAELLPQVCSFYESWGIAEAGLGHDEQAVSLIKRAIDKGCPPFRWSTRGTIPQRLDNQVYHQLLAPEALLDGIDRLDDDACLQRLRLLRHTMTPEIAQEVAGLIEKRKQVELRFAVLGLLMQVGAEAMPAWQTLLGAEDFVTRKQALRRIRELSDPRFLPLLEQHLEREQLPGNRHLAMLTAGELLLQGSEPWRGRTLLEAIPEGDYLYPIANARIAEWAEKSGQYAVALQYLEKVQAADPAYPIDDALLLRLRELVKGQSEAAPADQPE